MCTAFANNFVKPLLIISCTLYVMVFLVPIINVSNEGVNPVCIQISRILLTLGTC